MTEQEKREAAIRELSGMYRVATTNDLDGTMEAKRKNEAIDMAIAALEEQEPCEDAVSREDAMQAVRHAWAKGLEPSQYIEIMPSVTPKAQETKRGEWVKVHGYCTPGGAPVWRCPFCKSKESEHVSGIEINHSWHYCPECGARLKHPWND